MRRLFFRVLIVLAPLLSAAEDDAMLIERAAQSESADAGGGEAIRIYEELLARDGAGRRARAEAAYRLAGALTGQGRFVEAKNLYFRLLREFPEAEDLIPLAEEEVLKATAAIARDQVAANPSLPHRFGDLAISLLGALENNEAERAAALMQTMTTAVQTLAPPGGDPSGVFARLKAQTGEIAATLSGPGAAAALAKMRSATDFETFLTRAHPADPHDLFAPAWRLKDRLARALAANDAALAGEVAQTLERYLAPVATMPAGIKEGSLARLFVAMSRDAREGIAAGDFPGARARLDRFDALRHEQFPNLRTVASPPQRVPENLVSVEWAVLFRAELAVRELSRHGFALAMDHAQEGIAVAQSGAELTEGTELAELFRRQIAEFQKAHEAIGKDYMNAAQAALRRVGGK